MVKSPLSDVELMEAPIHDFVFKVMEMYTDNVAYIDGVTDQHYSFSDVLARTKRVASGLRRAGLKKGDVLAIISPNSPEFAFVFFATLACGAAVTPINPVYTVYEVGKQLQDSKATFIYTTTEGMRTSREAGKQTPSKKTFIVKGEYPDSIPLQRLLDDDGSMYPDSLVYNVHEDLAVIPYSSGTTGVPKGVMLTHFNIVSMFLQLSHPDLRVPDREVPDHIVSLSFLPYFHVYGMMANMVGGLIRGVTTVIMPRFDQVRFLELIEKYKVMTVSAVPPVVIFLAKSPLVKKYDISSLKSIGSGGAPLSPETIDELLENNKTVVEVSQGYGMTETTVAATSVAGFRPLRPGSVGVPIPNCEIQVVDPNTKSVLGPHERGEVWIRGPNIMKGYLNRPDATRETKDEDGWLHTGDVGYYDKDSFFFLVDRYKELIKFKGFQVAPAELEGLLLTHEDIADAAVIGVPDKEAGELPKAYVVVKPGAKLTADAVKKFVAEHVSGFKHLRGGVEFVPSIPKSQSGKILRRELRQQLLESKI